MAAMSKAGGAGVPALFAGGTIALLTLYVGWRQGALFLVACCLGVTLYQSGFGFSGAYRAFLVRGRVDGLRAQALMIGIATLLFAPLLWAGETLGWDFHGAVAPLGLQLVIGAFLFGIGMQLGGGCGSGTLFALGGGSARMAITLVAFCYGGFRASLDWPIWTSLPSLGPLVLGERMGWVPAAGLQALALGTVWWGLRALDRAPARTPETTQGWLGFPWTLTTGAILLALLNLATLVLSGGPWSITWGFTLVAAKLALSLGWDPSGHVFWQEGFQSSALSMPLASDPVVVMDVGIVLGAMMGAIAAGRMKVTGPLRRGVVAASIIGGLMLGYGARISFGCNIGAFFSGAASTSLHGWVWFGAALAGNWVGIRLRPRFGLDA